MCRILIFAKCLFHFIYIFYFEWYFDYAAHSLSGLFKDSFFQFLLLPEIDENWILWCEEVDQKGEFGYCILLIGEKSSPSPLLHRDQKKGISHIASE